MSINNENRERMATRVENAIYREAAKIFEGLESEGLITGNGHHIAQKLAVEAKRQVVERWTGKYDVPEEYREAIEETAKTLAEDMWNRMSYMERVTQTVNSLRDRLGIGPVRK